MSGEAFGHRHLSSAARRPDSASPFGRLIPQIRSRRFLSFAVPGRGRQGSARRAAMAAIPSRLRIVLKGKGKERREGIL